MHDMPGQGDHGNHEKRRYCRLLFNNAVGESSVRPGRWEDFATLQRDIDP